MSEFIQVDTYLQNRRREATDNAINLFKLELESKGGHTLSMSKFDEMYENHFRKACHQFEKDCDRFVENCREMEEEIVRSKPVHLRKLKDDLREFKDAMKKVNQFKRDENFERVLFELLEMKPRAWLEFGKIFKELTLRVQAEASERNYNRYVNDECFQTFGVHDPWSMDIWP